jgi:SAM-dependent methyltransferase
MMRHHRRKSPDEIDRRYQCGDTPWESGHPDDRLIASIETLMLPPCKVLEIGCGTGHDAVWLAQQGFTVTAIDQSTTAIHSARERADAADVHVNWISGDFLSRALRFAFDNGCFHTFDQPEDRQVFARTLRDHLAPNAIWLSLIASADAPRRTSGPVPMSAREICAAVEPWFEVMRLEADTFGIGRIEPPSSWAALMCRRDWAQRDG